MIKSVGEIWSERAAYIDEMFVRHYTRVFRVLTTDPSADGPDIVVTASAGGVTIPALGSTWGTDGKYVADTGARAQKITPKQDAEDPVHWTVTVEYTSEAPSGTNRDPALWIAAAGDPLTEPAEIRFDTETHSEVVIVDQQGSAVVNSAGEPFDPPMERTVRHLIIFLDYNVAPGDYNPTDSIQFTDSINTDLTTIGNVTIPPYCGRVRKYGGEPKYRDGQVYIRMAVEIEYWQGPTISNTVPTTYKNTPLGFLRAVLDAGYHIIASGKLIVANDQNGQPYSKPALLDESGGLLSVGGTPTFRVFHIEKEMQFTDLGLPDATL